MTNRMRWVKHLSSIPLTEGQESLLALEPNFMAVPLYQPNGEYITTVEGRTP